jgi:peptide/nickel transport system permease protein
MLSCQKSIRELGVIVVLKSKLFVGKPVGYRLSVLWLGLCAFFSIFGNLLPLPSWDFSDPDVLGVGMFSPGHFFGTDYIGVDQLSAIIHGTRYSLGIAFTTVFFAMVIGGFLGILAAYRRGWVDAVISMYFNTTLSIPTLILVVTMVAVFASPDPFDPTTTIPRILVVIIAITFVLIPVLGRLARSSALSWTGREFVLVAKSLGMKPRSILWHHIVPNVLPAMLSVGFLAAGVVIIVEGGLALLGAGAEPGASWGSLLARNRGDIALIPHTTFIPVVFITITVMVLNYFGDYFRNRIDSRESRI